MSHYTPNSYQYNKERRQEALEVLKKAKEQERADFNNSQTSVPKKKLIQ